MAFVSTAHERQALQHNDSIVGHLSAIPSSQKATGEPSCGHG
jgi:hypothetical protein